MDSLLALAATFSMDIFAEAKMPCLVTSFTYFTRVKIAIVAPLIMAALFVLAGIIYANYKVIKRYRKKVAVTGSMLRRERARGSHDSIVKDGCWIAAPYVLFTLDLFHPVITKTLCSYFTCRNLGAAGWWLEQARPIFQRSLFWRTM